MKKYIKIAALLGAMLLASPVITEAQGAGFATFAWSPSPSSGITNYTIYYGTSSGNYSVTNKVGNVLTATINNLTEGSVYYFSCSATDQFGLESVLTPEVIYTVPRTRPLPPQNFRRTAP